MADLKALLSSNVSSIKEPPIFPAGNYRLIITAYEFGIWPPNAKRATPLHGVAFKVKPLSCVEAEDNSNPVLAGEIQNALNLYGDWHNREFSFTRIDQETKERLLSVSALVFTLANADMSMHPMASRFYLNKDGVESGFVHDVLGLSFPNGAELGEVLDACVNRELFGRFVYEANQRDPSKPPYLTLKEVTSV
jgi:hypothetical protein